MDNHAIGIVVIGRNEGARLVSSLASLADAGAPIMYVDSGSTDGSVNVARRAGADVIELDSAEPFTAARARDEGARALLNREPNLRYIQFVDGDCTVAPTWFPAAVSFLNAHDDYAVVCGRRRERFPQHSVYNQLADLEWATPVGDAPACGGDALFRATALFNAGSFNPALVAGEEPELCSRLRERGWKIRRIDEEMTLHDAAMLSLPQWWRRAVRSGFGYAQAWRETKHATQPLYARELVRAFSWSAGTILIALVLGAYDHRLFLLAPVLWITNVARLAWRDGPARALSWQRSTLLMLGKFAEAWGAARYVGQSLFDISRRTGFDK